MAPLGQSNADHRQCHGGTSLLSSVRAGPPGHAGVWRCGLSPLSWPRSPAASSVVLLPGHPVLYVARAISAAVLEACFGEIEPRRRDKRGLLPLPLGEGWGQGFLGDL